MPMFLATLLTAIAFVLPQAAPPASSPAQPSGPPPAAAAIEQAAFLLGRWEGTGWIRMGPQRATFRQQETVRVAAGGTVLVVDGVGRSTDAGQNERLVHQAFGVLSWDAERKAYRWRAYRADGGELETTPEISADKFVWGFDGPNGVKIRFTITKTPAGEWFEIGELTRPGTTEPVQFFEMTLKRVGDA